MLSSAASLTGIEGTAGEKAVADLKRGHFAAAVIDAQDQIFGIGIVFDIHFAEFHAAILAERFARDGNPGTRWCCT